MFGIDALAEESSEFGMVASSESWPDTPPLVLCKDWESLDDISGMSSGSFPNQKSIINCLVIITF